MDKLLKYFIYLTIAVAGGFVFILVKVSFVDRFHRMDTDEPELILHRVETDEPDLVNPSFNPYELTIITLYTKLDKFQKGGLDVYINGNKYKDFMKTWAWLSNKVVAFFDDDETLEYFRSIRSAQSPNRTALIKVYRSQLDAFKDYEKIHAIYSQPDYPKHYPNTVNANYSCTMNAKYDVLQMAMDMGHVSTEFMAWLDIGTFRNLLRMNPKNETYTLNVPNGFNTRRVAFSEVSPHAKLSESSPWDYIKNNVVWVAGGFMIGSQPVVKNFIKSYKRTVRALLDSNMSSTDQQVIGAMYSPQFRQDQKVDIATYTCTNGDYGLFRADTAYFCLAYVSREAGWMRRNERKFKV